MRVKRKTGITVISLLLGWFALAAFGNSFAMIANTGYSTPFSATLAGIYGCLALLACVGLWKMRVWAYKVFLFWVVSALAIAVYFQQIWGAPMWQFAIFLVTVGMVMAIVARYINTSLQVDL